MYEDFKKERLTDDKLKDTTWQCVAREEEKFSIDLIYYKKEHIFVLRHVGKMALKMGIFTK